MAALTNAKLDEIYMRMFNLHLDERLMPLAHDFINAVFDALPAAGYIDEHNEMNFDEFMLGGSNTRPLYSRPELEK